MQDNKKRTIKKDRVQSRVLKGNNQSELKENNWAKPKENASRPSSARVGKYLEKYLEDFLFDEFTNEYIDRQQLDLSFMRGVPAPFGRQADFSVKELCINMAWIIGISPKFKYKHAYIAYIVLFYDDKTLEFLIGLAKKSAELKEYDAACVFYRAALNVKPDDLTALFGYAKTCREIYLSLDDYDQIGDYKAEAFEYFELTTVLHPGFADGLYYLGYAYLNLGLYQKAYLTWKRFLDLSGQKDACEEIKERMSQLTEPLEIEKGYNSVLAGRAEDGISILEPYLNSKYNNWWPLHYYLGISYKSIDESGKSEAMFKKVLYLNPSHVESMEELADIYKKAENIVSEEKYRRKAQLIRSGKYIE